MNLNYVRVVKFLEDYHAGKEEIPRDLIVEFLHAQASALERKNSPRKPFRLMLSNIGKPSCQLQYEKLGIEGEKQSYNASLRNAIGDFSEAWLVMIMKAAGIDVKDYQKSTQIELQDADTGDDIPIRGRLDIVIDNRLYDIKTTSKYAFKKYSEKGGIQAIIEEDSFGYIAQGFGYAEGEGVRFGGWWIINKDNGQLALYEIPDEVYDSIRGGALDLIRTNFTRVRRTKTIADIEKQFTDVAETYYNKPTGNRKLITACSYCPFRRHCWPEAKYLPNPNTKGKAKTYNWYTVYKDNNEEEISGGISISDSK
jgi:hypothetical protein